MARIRSVHPGLFTDESFASCSPHAQVLFIGIWTECDDQGAFEWKPVTLKMRLLPVANVDCGALLDELAGHDMVKRVTHLGKTLGLVRNFCRFQRPKKPKAWHIIPDEYRTYVALDDASSEPQPHTDSVSTEPKASKAGAVPRKREKPPQMEDGGGRREEEEEKKEAAQPLEETPSSASPSEPERPELPPVANVVEIGNRILDEIGRNPSLEACSFRPVEDWLAEGIDLERTILPTIRDVLRRQRITRGKAWAPQTLRFFHGAIVDAHNERKSRPKPIEPREPGIDPRVRKWHPGEWADAYRAWREADCWPAEWGPGPGQPGHLGPGIEAAEPQRAIA